jgi:hypothetical protein
MNIPTPFGTALAGTAFALALTGAAYAEKADIPVPKPALVSAFNSAVKGTRVHVHNYGPRNNWSWHKDQSYVQTPSGDRTSFSVPEYAYQVTKTGRTLKYYVKDFNATNITAFTSGAKIGIRLAFESAGQEIQAHCIRRAGPAWNRHWKECSLDIERDIHLNNAQLSMAVTPVARNGSISFDNPSVSFSADIKIANRLCRTFKGICGWIEGKIRSKMYPAIEQAMLATLNKKKLKDEVANRIRNAASMVKYIDPSWQVTNIRSQGGNYIVTVQRPDQIDGNSVRALGLKADKASQTATCPVRIGLKAAITTEYAMKGTGWLVHENGKKSRTFNWQTNKPGLVLSPASRAFQGQPGRNYRNLSTKIVVRWKGVDGKTYTKTSAPARYSVNCTRAAAGGMKMR